MKVDILGTEYAIVESRELESNSDGDCNFYSKLIRIRPLEQLLRGEGTDKEKEIRQKEVIRHEVVHAFLYESGLHDMACDEELVDWLAVQLPKINEVIKKAGG